MIDYESSIVARLWEILEGDSTFTTMVEPPNRIKLFAQNSDQQDEGIDPLKTGWNDGDFPEVIVATTDRTDSLWSLAPSYGTPRRSAGQSPMPVQVAITAVVEVIHLNVNFYRRRKLDDAIVKAIRAAGPTLGIDEFKLAPVGPLTRTGGIATGRAGEFGNAGGMRRLTSLFRLTCTVRTGSPELLA